MISSVHGPFLRTARPTTAMGRPGTDRSSPAYCSAAPGPQSTATRKCTDQRDEYGLYLVCLHCHLFSFTRPQSAANPPKRWSTLSTLSTL